MEQRDAALDVWVDGSCLNNGSDGAASAIGVYYGSANKRNFSSRLSTHKHTNNKAELLAVMYVLCTNPRQRNLRIHTDSQYAIRCLTEYCHRWKLNGWVTSKGSKVESLSIIRYILEVMEKREDTGSSTRLVYVKGHSEDVGNTAADRLANAAAHENIERGRIKLLRYLGAPF